MKLYQKFLCRASDAFRRAEFWTNRLDKFPWRSGFLNRYAMWSQENAIRAYEMNNQEADKYFNEYRRIARL